MVCCERTPNTSRVIPDLIGDLLVSSVALFEFGAPVFPKTKVVTCCKVDWIPDQIGDDTRAGAEVRARVAAPVLCRDQFTSQLAEGFAWAAEAPRSSHCICKGAGPGVPLRCVRDNDGAANEFTHARSSFKHAVEQLVLADHADDRTVLLNHNGV